MQEGFAFKNRITNRGNSIDMGGDGRYRYDLCPNARTVNVIDTAQHIGTFASLSITSATILAVINLTAGNNYGNIVYRSKFKQVWVFGTANVHVIDANPASANFNSIIQTIITTQFNSSQAAITYCSLNDLFYSSNFTYSPTSGAVTHSQVALSGNNIFFITNSGYFPKIGAIACGESNGEVTTIRDYQSLDIIQTLGNVNTVLSAYKIGSFYYSGQNQALRRISPQAITNAIITMTHSSARGDMAYNPITKHVVVSHYNGNTLNVATISPFANVGSLSNLMTGILAANQTTFQTVNYSPYSGKIYVRGGTLGTVVTGVNRVYIIDTTQSLANMVCGYYTIDNASVAATTGFYYSNTQSCFNILKINEYD